MIKIEFTGGPGTIHDSIRDYLKQAKQPVSKDAFWCDDYDYHYIDSKSSSTPHVVTILGRVPIACTCMWFRHHPPGSGKITCRHMKIVKENVRT
jgi:hypothetical protein